MASELRNVRRVVVSEPDVLPVGCLGSDHRRAHDGAVTVDECDLVVQVDCGDATDARHCERGAFGVFATGHADEMYDMVPYRVDLDLRRSTDRRIAGERTADAHFQCHISG